MYAELLQCNEKILMFVSLKIILVPFLTRGIRFCDYRVKKYGDRVKIGDRFH